MVINRENKYKGFLNIDELTIETKSGTEVKREVMYRRNAVAALVYDTVIDKYVFTIQFRPGSECELIEIPAGTLEENEDPIEAMKREILEEIGYKTDSIELIEECYVSPGGNTELMTIYYVEVSDKVEKGGGLESEHEEITILYMDYDEVVSTKFRDAKTIISVNWLKIWLSY